MAEYGHKTHIVVSGDSLQKIAVLYGVSDWREIAYFNNLTYPYVSDDFSQEYQGKVARLGDAIFIPSYDYVVAPTSRELSISDLEEEVYGCDLDIYSVIDDNNLPKNLEEKGELTGNNGDLMLAKGIHNLKQQLTIKLSTQKGTLMLHPEWGCNVLNMVGTKGTEENLIDMMLMVREALLEDFRVASVSNLSVNKDSNSVTVDCDIQPISPYPTFKYHETLYA